MMGCKGCVAFFPLEGRFIRQQGFRQFRGFGRRSFGAREGFRFRMSIVV